MDLTNRYIIMCHKAEDIQNAWRPRQCDFIIEQGTVDEGLSFCKQGAGEVRVAELYYEDPESQEYEQECEELKNMAVWLPRQDQLQCMIEPDESKVYLIIDNVLSARYRDFSKDTDIEANRMFHSMEQLWLAYVMKVHFSKVWNEVEWIPEID